MFNGFEEKQVNANVHKLSIAKIFHNQIFPISEIMPFTLVSERTAQVGRNKMVFPTQQ